MTRFGAVTRFGRATSQPGTAVRGDVPVRAVPAPDEVELDRPGTGLFDALLVGNGRLGATVLGHPSRDRLHLNHDEFWSGDPAFPSTGAGRVGWLDPPPPRATEDPAVALARVRHAVLAQDPVGAHRAAHDLLGPWTESFQPGAWLELSDGDGEVTDYRRRLDLVTGIATVTFECDGVRTTREILVSAPDGVVAVRWTGASPDAEIAWDSVHPHEVDTERVDAVDAVGAVGAVDAVELAVLSTRAPVHADPDYSAGGPGVVYARDGGTVLHGVFAVDRGPDPDRPGRRVLTVFASLATGPGGRADAAHAVLEARRRGWAEVRAAHLADLAATRGRAGLELPGHPEVERIVAVGRHLVAASSRPGTQPSTLQGIWNLKVQPPWSSNWTTNVNLPMAYWPALPWGMAAAHGPLLDLIDDLVVAGERTARDRYGAPGWVVHHNTDRWRTTAAVGGSPTWALWPMAGSWLCTHVLEHHRYTGDRDRLERAWPALRGNARFVLSMLVEDPSGDGTLVVCPSTSPENEFLAEGERVAVGAGSAIDQWLASAALTDLAEAARVLGHDGDPVVLAASQVAPRLRLPGIGPDGRLLEWRAAMPEAEPGHRHLSHLWGVFPGNAVDVLDPSAGSLVAAAERSLRYRVDRWETGATPGWSLAWATAVAARLGLGELAGTLIERQLAEQTSPSLLGLHPTDLVQLDASFGAAAAVAETLVQSHNGVVRLLPALPPAWADGSVRGLRTRGGHEVAMTWRAGQLVSARIRVGGPGQGRDGDGGNGAGLRVTIGAARGEGRRVRVLPARDGVVEVD